MAEVTRAHWDRLQGRFSPSRSSTAPARDLTPSPTVEAGFANFGEVGSLPQWRSRYWITLEPLMRMFDRLM